MKKALAYSLTALSIGALSVSCSDMETPKTEQTAELQERWDASNNPLLMNAGSQQSYEFRLNALPESKFLSTQPWSDDYWATYKGGITYRWNHPNQSERYGYKVLRFKDLKNVDISKLSPAEKFDIYMGWEDFSFTRYELSRTNIMRTVPGSSEYDPSFKIPRWEGLCHAWAPATLLLDEPNPVTLTGPSGIKVPFGSSDIKALMISFFHYNNSSTTFLGERCNFNLNELDAKFRRGELSKDAYMKARRSCDDTNAGAFHVVLANQIGLKNEGFVADVTRDFEVWNQAVYGFKSRIGSPRNRVSPTAAPGTVQEVDVRTEMFYTTEIAQSFARPTSQPRATKQYAYTLELDSEGRIIGGTWISAERPDFLWMQTMPKAEGMWSDVWEIYERSTRARAML